MKIFFEVWNSKLLTFPIRSGGSAVLSFKSRFIATAILKERSKKIDENRGKSVELDFRLHSAETVKVNFNQKIFIKRKII